jgi:hypothetical protein
MGQANPRASSTLHLCVKHFCIDTTGENSLKDLQIKSIHYRFMTFLPVFQRLQSFTCKIENWDFILIHRHMGQCIAQFAPLSLTKLSLLVCHDKSLHKSVTADWLSSVKISKCDHNLFLTRHSEWRYWLPRCSSLHHISFIVDESLLTLKALHAMRSLLSSCSGPALKRVEFQSILAPAVDTCILTQTSPCFHTALLHIKPGIWVMHQAQNEVNGKRTFNFQSNPQTT